MFSIKLRESHTSDVSNGRKTKTEELVFFTRCLNWDSFGVQDVLSLLYQYCFIVSSKLQYDFYCKI